MHGEKNAQNLMESDDQQHQRHKQENNIKTNLRIKMWGDVKWLRTEQWWTFRFHNNRNLLDSYSWSQLASTLSSIAKLPLSKSEDTHNLKFKKRTECLCTSGQTSTCWKTVCGLHRGCTWPACVIMSCLPADHTALSLPGVAVAVCSVCGQMSLTSDW